MAAVDILRSKRPSASIDDSISNPGDESPNQESRELQLTPEEADSLKEYEGQSIVVEVTGTLNGEMMTVDSVKYAPANDQQSGDEKSLPIMRQEVTPSPS